MTSEDSVFNGYAGQGPPAEPAPASTPGHRLELMCDMGALFDSMRQAADAARERLWIATYIYRHDAAGRFMGEALMAAARRGVDVRLLYDALGSWRTDKGFFAELAAAGVEVRAFRPLPIVMRELDPWPRDHGRIVVIDDTAYTGGLAWGYEWLPRSRGGLGWRDAGILVRGPCVKDFAHLFERRWGEADGIHPPDDVLVARYPDVELITDGRSQKNRVCARHCERIRRARSRIFIEHGYFLPPICLREGLFAAAARGVDVRLIVPGPTDLPIISRAAHDEYADWLDAGLKIYEYSPTILHSKIALVDDDWATVGTFNGNITSLLWAYEINVLAFAGDFVRQMEAEFEHDFQVCRRVTKEHLRRRPALSQMKDWSANNLLRTLETQWEDES